MGETGSATRGSARRRRRLDQGLITQAAVDLLDEVGLAELSTRRLAAKLGVRSPTLYWHVRDKDELLDLVAEAICADAFEIDPTLHWRDQLASGLRQFRELLMAHRDAATLLRQRPPTGPHRLGHIDTTVRILLQAGFAPGEAAGIARLLTAHALASADDPTRSLPAADAVSGEGPLATRLRDHPHLDQVATTYARLSGQELFDLGVEIIFDGLVHRAASVTPHS